MSSPQPAPTHRSPGVAASSTLALVHYLRHRGVLVPERVEALLERRLGAITLARGPDPAPDPQAIVDMLVEKALENSAKLLPAELLARARFAGVEGLTGTGLTDTAEIWLAPLLQGQRDLGLSKGPMSR